MRLQKGDLITISDFSWAGRVGKDGKMTHNGSCEPNCHQRFKVVVTNCAIPTYKIRGDMQIADTVVIGQEDGSVWFVCSSFVRPVKYEITVEGAVDFLIKMPKLMEG